MTGLWMIGGRRKSRWHYHPDPSGPALCGGNLSEVYLATPVYTYAFHYHRYARCLYCKYLFKALLAEDPPKDWWLLSAWL